MDKNDLLRKIRALHGRGYKQYKSLKGRYAFGRFFLELEHIQADPFASPSRVKVTVLAQEARLPSYAYAKAYRKLGLENFLAWLLKRAALRESKRLGTGKSGLIRVHGPGQEILPRSAVQVLPDGTVEVRFFVGLPAAGRRILADAAERLLLKAVPRLVEENLLPPHPEAHRLRAFVETTEDASFLRDQLARLGLVAFVAEGSILPRASGVDPRPAQGAVPFEVPEELAVEIELPNRGKIRGMGVPQGVTLIVGGGFHGKSTLLRALETGVYNHIPGDGRELVVSLYESVKIRAEDGRSIVGVDISPFINNLPLGQDTRFFTTPCASGSTSQAANIMEALEVGAQVLLLDEDTSATNFMIRDARMQALITKDKEPITPFLDRVRELYQRLGVSSVLVVGGCGDYLEVADTVIAMESYRPKVVTQEARAIVARYPSARKKEAETPFPEPRPRRVSPGALNPRKGVKEVAKARGLKHLSLGREDIDLSAVEQLLEEDQTRALALGLLALAHRGAFSVAQGVQEIETMVQEKGLLSLSPVSRGDLAGFRRFELAAALNRLRTLKIEGPDAS